MSGLFKSEELLFIVVWVYLLFVRVLLLIAFAVELERFEGKKADHRHKHIDILNHLKGRKIVQALPLFKHSLLHFYSIAECFHWFLLR